MKIHLEIDEAPSTLYSWRSNSSTVAVMPFCRTRPPIETRPLTKERESRAERYRRLALAETDAARAKILWQLVDEAQRLLCISDGSWKLPSRPRLHR